MSKRPAKPAADAAQTLSIPERVLLFCVANDTNWEHAGDDSERSHPARANHYSSSPPKTLPVLGLTRCIYRHAWQLTVS